MIGPRSVQVATLEAIAVPNQLKLIHFSAILISLRGGATARSKIGQRGRKTLGY